MTLRIDPVSAQVVVTLPRAAPRAAGVALLARHAGWVEARLSAMPPASSFSAGSAISLHGKPHRIAHGPGSGVAASDGVLRVGTESGDPARRLLRYLREEARQGFEVRTESKARAAEVRIGGIKLRDTRSRWGSCSPEGVLMFSWRLVMAPPAVQDYVAAHETAHLRHLDHGPHFWALTEQLSPHRPRAEAWLRRHGPALLRVGRG